MVWLATLAGFILRFWRLDHGLPEVFYSDEGRYVYLALNMGGGDLNPHYFFHPNLYYYLCFFADLLYIAGGLLTGFFKVPGDAWELYRRDPTVFFVIGRSLSAMLGTLTIPLTYLIGKKLFDKSVGVLGAFFLAFSFLHVQFSQIGNLDASLTFFIMLTFLLACLALERDQLRYFLLAGLAAGLAGSTKHQGFETLLWGPLACFLIALRHKTNPFSEIFGKKCLGFFIFFALGFTLGTPYWLLDFEKFKSDVLFHWFHYKTRGEGQLGYEGNWNWLYYLSTPLSYGLGLPLMITGILGIFFLVSRPTPKNIFVVSFPLIYFFIAGLSRIRTARYMMPLVPFLCLAAAVLMIHWVQFRFSARLSARGARLPPARQPGRDGQGPASGGRRTQNDGVLLGVLGLILILPGSLSTARYAYLRTTEDTRHPAAAWVREKIASEDSVLYTNYTFLRDFPGGPRLAPVDRAIFDTQFNNRSSLKTLDEYRKEGFDYLVLDEWHKAMVLEGGARDARYRQTIQRYRDFLNELEGKGKLVATFSPYRESVPPDLENVEIPSRSLWKMKSSGPEIWIYKL